MKKLNKKGFTIVELVIVIAVIAILAAVLIPTFATVIKKANKSAAEQALRNAYTEAMAEALSDGEIANNEAIYIYTDGTVSSQSNLTNKTVEWTFTFTNANGQAATVTRASDTTNYNYAIEDGKIKVTDRA